MTGLLRDVAPVLPTTPGSIRDHLAKGVRGPTRAGHIYVWASYYEVDGVVASAWLLAALTLASVCGLGVGFGTGDGKLGMGVGASVLGIVMAIHLAIMMWPA
jgi:hypothetical protein